MDRIRQWGQWFALLCMSVLLLCGCGAVNQATTEVQTAAEIQTAVEIQTAAEVNTTAVEVQTAAAETSEETTVSVDEDGEYTSVEEVALYLHIYAKLPGNYITKKEAERLGWDSKKGNLWDVAPGKSIGGSKYGNYEQSLPEKNGRKYYECDVNYEGGYRGADRIIYSNDGLVYYTGDHYKTFTLLYE